MNWNKIKKKYPKAWGKLKNEHSIAFSVWDNEYRLISEDCAGEFSEDKCSFNIRVLYDFFDEQGVYIIIDIEFHNMKNRWDFTLLDNDDYDLTKDNCYDYKTRTEAEEQAFEKAFEILEEKL